MRVINQILLSLVVLSIFMNLGASSQMSHLGQDNEGSNGDDREDSTSSVNGSTTDVVNCDSPISVAVLPWPPYARNVSDDWQTKVIEGLKLDYPADYTADQITFHKMSGESELTKLFKTNKTVIAFPLIERYGSEQRHIMVHPGLDFFVAPQLPSPGKVCVDTLLQSWPLLALSLILTGMAGILIWLLEMISNPEEFPAPFARGTWEGFWWAFISITTVGYGDKCPRSIAGRCFAVIWIFAGLVLLAVFMANVTTALTSVSVKPGYHLSDTELVGVVPKSLEEEVARNNNAEVKVFENYDNLMSAFRQRLVSGIVIDRYTFGVLLLNETGAFRKQILRSKHFSLTTKYRIIANISQNYDIDNECYENIVYRIKEVMTKRLLGQREIQSWQGIQNSSSATMHSFNLFMKSKEFLEKATYISLAILGGLIFVGLVFDKIFRKASSHRIEEYELNRVNDQDYEIIQDIAKGKELLKELQLLHQKLEEKINLSSAWKRKSAEVFRDVKTTDGK